MEAQSALAKIEAYRHAEEMARIEGTTKITLAKIEATSSMTIAKLTLLKTNLEHTSKKELALIRAIESTPNQASQLLKHLEQAANEKQGLLQHISMDEPTTMHIEISDYKHSVAVIPKTNNPKVNNNEWKIRLMEWARANQIPRQILPRKLTKLLRVKTIDLSYYGLSNVPIELANLINLKELKLNNNHLTTIPKELAKLTNLTLLDVRGNPLSELPKPLCDNESLLILKEGD